jgi:exodeoxyribonuclease VII small subunit
MDTKIKDFESAMTELESIVKTLENGQLPLEQSLEHFERGIALSRYCHTRLEKAEQRVEVLTQSGETTSAPRALTDTLTSSEDSE